MVDLPARALIAFASLLLATVSARAKPRVVFLVPTPASAAWQDEAFLAAVPAACRSNGEPIVLCVDPAKPWRPELLDFIRRYEPARVYWLAKTAPADPPAGVVVETLACDSAEGAACVLASKFFATARAVVLYVQGDRAAAMSASVLAARAGAPVFPYTNGVVSKRVRDCLTTLGARRAVLVGAAVGAKVEGLRTEVLPNAETVVAWLERQRHRVEYLAATNPNDVTLGPAPKLSLAAVVLAAGRNGALVPLPYATLWKQRHATNETLAAVPRGVAASTKPLRRGTLALGQDKALFVTGCDANGGWFVQIDRNGDGDFEDQGEAAVGTGGTIGLAGRGLTVDLDADEKARGQSLWLTSPTPVEIRGDLARYREAASGHAEYLCLVGWPDTLPMAVIGSAHGIDADLVSDLPLGQTDGDAFVELAATRFVAEDCASATLIACRGLAYDDFRERAWHRKFATVEWDGPSRVMLETHGLRFAGHQADNGPITSGSAMTEANLIEHGSHASWCDLGKTYSWNATTLLAPCLVDSSGCSTASLDQDPHHRSVAARMLKNGAVAFAGNSRRGIAEHSLFRSELLNALSRGLTLGQANRAAQNRVIVATLEKDQTVSGNYRYQLYTQAVFGDPALDLDFPEVKKPARVLLRGSTATVYPPSKWTRIEYGALAEWDSRSPKLHTFRGAGVGIESTWDGARKHNVDIPVFTAEIRTRKQVTGVQLIDDAPTGLGWTGRFFVDEHADGTRSVYWRTRLLDFDMETGAIRARASKQPFRLKSR